MSKTMILMTALILSGCAVGPEYVPPATVSRGAGPLLGSTSASVVPAQPQGDWWKLYDDPVLNQLIEDALSANTDIRVAVARLERSRASLRGARADRLPQTSLSAGGGYRRLPAIQTLPGQEREGSMVQGSLAVGYELDLFGRVKRSIESARGNATAAADDVEAIKVAVVADTTRAYVDAASSAHRLTVARHTVDLLDQSLRVTRKRLEVGRAAMVDILRLSALREEQAAQVPEIEAERQAALYSLATLTGRTPTELPTVAGERETPPQITQPIPVGDGTALLERRPDVRAAERRLAADTARIGIVTSDLYPRITLGTSVGQTSTSFGNLFTAGPLGFLLGPAIDWSFLNQEEIRARIAASRADANASLAQFDGTVLKALEETETALSNYAKALEQQKRLEIAREQANAAALVMRGRQREGQVDFVEVIDAERNASDTEAQYALAQARVAGAQIDLFKALGGGWQSSSGAPYLARNEQHGPSR